MDAFLGFLNYGGLGLAALVCVAVLVFQSRGLHALIGDQKTTVERLKQARPLLEKQMLYSLIGMLAISAGALAVAYVELRQKHCARITIEPGDSVEKLADNQEGLARIKIDEEVFNNARSSFPLETKPGAERYVHIDIMPYVKFKLQEASKLQATTIPLEKSNGLSEPEI